MKETPTQIDRRTLARYATLARRVATDIRLLHDAALAIQLPFNRLARVKRARREISDELRALESATEGRKQDVCTTATTI
jgi:hypothetical protein